MGPARPGGLAPKDSAKYREQVWAGLVVDPPVLAAEKKRRAAAMLATRTRELGAREAEAMARHEAAGLMVEPDGA